jgi:hypothetical protein
MGQDVIAAETSFSRVSGLLCHAVSRSPRWQTTLAYHIGKVVVQYSKTGRSMTEMGHNPNGFRPPSCQLPPAADTPASRRRGGTGAD